MKDDIVPVKTSFSVPELRSMLGLSKVESYWLVHQQRFTTVIAGGRMRVMRDSFEQWYAGQFHYKKVVGTPPGEKWTGNTMSVQEAADLLGVSTGLIYTLSRNGAFQRLYIDRKIRIDTQSFESWYQNQSRYKKMPSQTEVI